MRTIKLRLTLTCWEKEKGEAVWRIIEVPENKTLHQLHLAIQKAFGWYNDHLYSFFMRNIAWDNEAEYTSLVNIEESKAKLAAKIKLKNFNLKLKQKFLYIYDFGDNLEHQIEVVGFGRTDEYYKYPQVISSFGAAPEQYAIRRWDKEEDEILENDDFAN